MQQGSRAEEQAQTHLQGAAEGCLQRTSPRQPATEGGQHSGAAAVQADAKVVQQMGAVQQLQPRAAHQRDSAMPARLGKGGGGGGGGAMSGRLVAQVTCDSNGSELRLPEGAAAQPAPPAQARHPPLTAPAGLRCQTQAA